LSLRQNNTEKAPLGGKPTIITSGQNASYTVSSGAVSGYSIMVNTIIPIGFPEVLQEFENGKVYIVTYDGTNLALTATWPIPSPAWPIASKNVRAEEISSTSIRISWDSICDADSYRVYRAIDNSANQYSLIATVNTPYHIDNYLQSSRSYFYKVSAIKDSKEGEQSNIFSFTNISPPQNFRAVGKGDTFILLSWSTELSAEIYCIYRSESSDGNYQKVNAPITHTWGTGYNNSYNYWYLWDTDINLKPLTTYYYKIYSVNQFGTESLKYSAITVPTVPNISFQVNHTSTNSITLGWNNLENATYDIYRSDNRNGVYNKISNNIVTNTYVDSNLIPNQTYWYYISVTFRVVEGVSSQTIQLSDRVVSATVEG
jgi:fibronectin type 3 domain-containing protein